MQRLRLRPLDQASLQLQSLPQSAFLASHLAIIPLVIEARQMENSVQHENFYLRSQRVTQAGGILPCDLRGYREVARHLLSWRVPQWRRWKRQYVCRFVLSPEAQVQGAKFSAVGHQNIHGATQTHGPPRPQ
jgi:hypothetical protein